MTKETTSIDESIEEILEDLIYDTPNHYGYPPDFEPDFTEAKQAILSLVNEARIEGYIQGGVDEILRHEKARKAVMEELTHE